jgi:SAM-dependent methyltransferase
MLDSQFAEVYHQRVREESSGPTFLRELMENAGLSAAHRRVLDIGCGDATHLTAVVDRFPGIEYGLGIDLSPAMLAQSVQLPPVVQTAVADMQRIPAADACFDFVFSRYTIHYSKPLAATFAEVARVTRAGGIFYVRDAHPITGLMLKPSRDYATKEDADFPVQCAPHLTVSHPCFTFAEYVEAIVGHGWEILHCREPMGRRSSAPEFAPYRVPTVITFTLRRVGGSV